jgi:hypothetical protein
VTRLPNPNGCRLCGIDQRGHAIQTGPDGTHTWQQPTPQQIKDRMRARRETTQASKLIRELEAQLYAEDPSDRADAYLTLQAMDALTEHTGESLPEGQLSRARKRSRQGFCPNCGTTPLEPHPRLPVLRCSNCKEHERVKHSGPDTKFCVLCLSGEHERVEDQ